MSIDRIPFRETGFFSPLICDYLDNHSKLSDFHSGSVSIQAFEKQIQAKKSQFSLAARQKLAQVLKRQHASCTSPAVDTNIAMLANEKTFTVTTGHQLNLCTGPLYFIYKIISTINLSRQLKQAYPDCHFVPVYWMATEDHDFDEISFFHFDDKKIQWNDNQVGGAVGRMSLESLTPILDYFLPFLGTSNAAQTLRMWIENSYKQATSLAEATRILVHQIFADEGLIILDADDPIMKQQFAPIMEKELLHQICNQEVTRTIGQIQSTYSPDYRPQVNPREINLFYFSDNGRRERLEPTNEGYKTVDSAQNFSTSEMLNILHQHPERFSPNVLMRPLYQELILPNLGYLGGGGELAYWLQLKSYFEAVEVPFPLLILRNSAVLAPGKIARKMAKLELTPKDFFAKRDVLINKKIRAISNIDLDLSPFKALLQKQFDHLSALVDQTDASFAGTVHAQRQKQFNGIDALEKRLLNAQKKKLVDHVARLSRLHNLLFPQEKLQERHDNFMSHYLVHGSLLFSILKENLDPFDASFLWITFPDS